MRSNNILLFCARPLWWIYYVREHDAFVVDNQRLNNVSSR
jgi:hypothetical protein